MNHLQQKTSILETTAGKVDLKLNNKKCKVLKANIRCEDLLKVGQNKVEEDENFTYLGANVTSDGEDTANVRNK